MSHDNHDTSSVQSSSESYREWKAWNEQEFAKFDPVEARYFDDELTRSGIAFSDGLPLLEIGFGNGSFAAWARARGYDYSGTELDPGLVERAIRHGFRAFPATLDLDALDLPVQPSCIVAFDVLEHLTTKQIVALLGASAKILPSGGAFLARVPSGDSPFARHIQHGDITHCSTLGSSAVRQLAAMTGLQVAQIRPPAFPLRGIGPRRWLRRAPVAAMRALTARLIQAAFHDNQPTVISSNMLLVLRKPRV